MQLVILDRLNSLLFIYLFKDNMMHWQLFTGNRKVGKKN